MSASRKPLLCYRRRSHAPDLELVIPDSIRDPVPRSHWIAGAETPDLIRGRNDIDAARDDKLEIEERVI